MPFGYLLARLLKIVTSPGSSLPSSVKGRLIAVLSSSKPPSDGGSTARAAGDSVKQASMSGTSSKTRRKGESVIEFVMCEVLVFIKRTFLFPRLVNCATAGLNEGKRLSGEAPSPGSRLRFLEILQKISPAWQERKL